MINNNMTKPGVGLGILVFNDNNQILLSRRIKAHGNSMYGPPGGHLEFGETFEQCAIREVKEETDLDIENPEFLAITNDVFEAEGKHYISIFMKAKYVEGGVIRNMEPEKAEGWEWFDIANLPNNLFLPLENLFKQQAYGFDIKEMV